MMLWQFVQDGFCITELLHPEERWYDLGKPFLLLCFSVRLTRMRFPLFFVLTRIGCRVELLKRGQPEKSRSSPGSVVNAINAR